MRLQLLKYLHIINFVNLTGKLDKKDTGAKHKREKFTIFLEMHSTSGQKGNPAFFISEFRYLLLPYRY
jgi:hypothetical protein